MKFGILLLLFCITNASPRMRGSHRFIVQGLISVYSIIIDTLTATMQSDQNYDVVNLPITVSIHFSSSVSQFDSSQCVVCFIPWFLSRRWMHRFKSCFKSLTLRSRCFFFPHLLDFSLSPYPKLSLPPLAQLLLIHPSWSSAMLEPPLSLPEWHHFQQQLHRLASLLPNLFSYGDYILHLLLRSVLPLWLLCRKVNCSQNRHQPHIYLSFPIWHLKQSTLCISQERNLMECSWIMMQMSVYSHSQPVEKQLKSTTIRKVMGQYVRVAGGSLPLPLTSSYFLAVIMVTVSRNSVFVQNHTHHPIVVQSWKKNWIIPMTHISLFMWRSRCGAHSKLKPNWKTFGNSLFVKVFLIVSYHSSHCWSSFNFSYACSDPVVELFGDFAAVSFS